MQTVLLLNIYLFPIILSGIIFSSICRGAIQSMNNRLFCVVLIFTNALLVLELVCWGLDGKDFFLAGILMWGVRLIYFLMMPAVSVLWLNYTSFYLSHTTIFQIHWLKHTLLMLPLTLYYIMVLSTYVTGWIFRIDANHYFVKGSYYYVSYLIMNFYTLIILGLLVKAFFQHKSSFKKMQIVLMSTFIVFSIIASMFQIGATNFWAGIPLLTLSEMFFYIQILNQQITADALTGLNNRGCFDRYIKTQMEQGEEKETKYLFMMDLDGFKKINDKYGHAQGDTALIQTGTILTKFFHMSNAFLARYGGDEFCAVLHCRNQEEAVALAEELQENFREESEQGGYPCKLSISVGFAPLRWKDGVGIEEVIRQADKMMYENKRRRKKA